MPHTDRLAAEPLLKIFFILPNIYGSSRELFERILASKNKIFAGERDENGAVHFKDPFMAVHEYFIQLSLTDGYLDINSFNPLYEQMEIEETVEQIRQHLVHIVLKHEILFNPRGDELADIDVLSQIDLSFIAPSFATSRVDKLLTSKKPETDYKEGCFFNFMTNGKHTPRYRQVEVFYMDPLIHIREIPDVFATAITKTICEYIQHIDKEKLLHPSLHIQATDLGLLEKKFKEILTWLPSTYSMLAVHFFHRLYFHITPDPAIQKTIGELKDAAKDQQFLITHALFSRHLANPKADALGEDVIYADTHEANAIHAIRNSWLHSVASAVVFAPAVGLRGWLRVLQCWWIPYFLSNRFVSGW